MKKQITGALVTGIFLAILYGSAVHFEKVEATDTASGLSKTGIDK